MLGLSKAILLGCLLHISQILVFGMASRNPKTHQHDFQLSPETSNHKMTVEDRRSLDKVKSFAGKGILAEIDVCPIRKQRRD